MLVNDQCLATESLGDTGKEAFYHVDLPLPDAMVTGREITVAFQAHPGNTAGGLFDLRVLHET